MYRALGDCRDFGFRDQIQRAAVSVMSNIAEGFDRGTNKEFTQFLVISRASASEVRSLSYTGLDLGYFNQEVFDAVTGRCENVANLINGFIRYLRGSTRRA